MVDKEWLDTSEMINKTDFHKKIKHSVHAFWKDYIHNLTPDNSIHQHVDQLEGIGKNTELWFESGLVMFEEFRQIITGFEKKCSAIFRIPLTNSNCNLNIFKSIKDIEKNYLYEPPSVIIFELEKMDYEDYLRNEDSVSRISIQEYPDNSSYIFFLKIFLDDDDSNDDGIYRRTIYVLNSQCRSRPIK